MLTLRQRRVIPDMLMNLEASTAEEERSSSFSGTDAEFWQEIGKIASNATSNRDALFGILLICRKYHCTIGAIERRMVESSARSQSALEARWRAYQAQRSSVACMVTG